MVIPQDLPDINGGDTNNHIKVARNRGKTDNLSILACVK